MPQGGGDRDLFLKRSRDIEYAKKHGRRISTALFNMVICADGCEWQPGRNCGGEAIRGSRQPEPGEAFVSGTHAAGAKVNCSRDKPLSSSLSGSRLFNPLLS